MTDLPSLISEGRRLIEEATKGPLDISERTPYTVVAGVDGGVRVIAHHAGPRRESVTRSNAALHVLAVNALPQLLDVAEAGERLLAYHDNCGMESTHGDALRAALAKLKEVG